MDNTCLIDYRLLSNLLKSTYALQPYICLMVRFEEKNVYSLNQWRSVQSLCTFLNTILSNDMISVLEYVPPKKLSIVNVCVKDVTNVLCQRRDLMD